jgi:ankyrin repeat protein
MDRQNQIAAIVNAQNGEIVAVQNYLKKNPVGYINIQHDMNSQKSNGVIFTVHGTTLFMEACAFGHDTLVSLLYDDPNLNNSVRTSEGWSALHAAAANGHDTICEILCQHGYDPKEPDNAGYTPIDAARNFKHNEALTVLQKYVR